AAEGTVPRHGGQRRRPEAGGEAAHGAGGAAVPGRRDVRRRLGARTRPKDSDRQHGRRESTRDQSSYPGDRSEPGKGSDNCGGPLTEEPVAPDVFLAVIRPPCRSGEKAMPGG